jgi:transmembrane secretion effector
LATLTPGHRYLVERLKGMVLVNTGTTVVGSRAEVTRFLGVWLPTFLTSTALSLATFGLNWWIAGTPNGGANLGVVVGIANIVAVIVVALLSGMLDRKHRARSTLTVLLCAAGCVALVDVVFVTPASLTMLAFATVCYIGVEVLRSTYLAVMETTNADLAPRHWSPERVATLIQSQPQVERIVVPAVGGTLIAAGALYALPIVGVGLLCVVLSTLVFSFRHFASVSRTDHVAQAGGWLRSVRGDVKDSVAFIRRDPDLLFMLVIGVLINVVSYPFYSLLPAYISRYGLNASQQATLYGRAGLAYGIGLLVGTLVMIRVGRHASKPRIGRAAIALGVDCVVLLVTNSFDQPAVLIASMTMVGGLLVVCSTTTGAIWLHRVPAVVRVRVFSVRRLAIYSSIPLGTSLMGFGGTAFGYPQYLRIHLVAVLVVLAVAWFLRLRRGRRAPSAPAQD